MLMEMLYFSKDYSLHYFLSFLLIYVGLGVGVGSLGQGFWGWGFQLMGFGACGVRPRLGLLGLGLSIST